LDEGWTLEKANAEKLNWHNDHGNGRIPNCPSPTSGYDGVDEPSVERVEYVEVLMAVLGVRGLERWEVWGQQRLEWGLGKKW
jgi:hypothetical protein